MGILSTFCIAVFALVLDRTCGAEPEKHTLFSVLWRREQTYILLGSIAFALAAAFFYLQRSALAWFYGQIALSLEMPSVNGVSTENWYKDADSWATWTPYQNAFIALGIGGGLYLIALVGADGAVHIPAWLVWMGTGLVVMIQIVRAAIFRRHRYDDDPIGRVLPLLKRG